MQSEAGLSEPIPLSLSPRECRNIFSNLCDFHLMAYTALLEMKEGKRGQVIRKSKAASENIMVLPLHNYLMGFIINYFRMSALL